MNGDDIVALLPLLVIGGAATAVMLVIAWHRHHAFTAALTMLGLVMALMSLWPVSQLVPRTVTPLLVIDDYGIFYMGLLLLATLAVALLAYPYLASSSEQREEFYLLLLLAAFGALVLVVSGHFASFIIGLETLSVSLFGLIAYPRREALPIEASIKYFILNGFSSSFLLFGTALIYARLGSLRFSDLLDLSEAGQADIVGLAGLALILVGIGFKLSLVPFHMWAPDVYQGAPAPVTAFIAVVSKAAVFALLLRLFLTADAHHWAPAVATVNTIAIASMLVGNLLALLQDDVKRLLAYSSIGHLGYVLVGFLAGGTLAIEAVGYYLAAYVVMSLGAFGVITVLSSGDGADVAALDDYRALVWRHPWLGAIFTLMLLSLAGLPLTMGFFGKFYAILGGVTAALWPAVIALVIGSVIGLFYYLRIVTLMWAPLAAEARLPALGRHWLLGLGTLTVISLVLLGFGIYPAPLIDLIRSAMPHVLP